MLPSNRIRYTELPTAGAMILDAERVCIYSPCARGWLRLFCFRERRAEYVKGDKGSRGFPAWGCGVSWLRIRADISGCPS